MPRPKEVRITKGDQEAMVMKESVKAWERHGWTRADDGSSEQDQSTAPASTPATPAEARTTRKAP